MSLKSGILPPKAVELATMHQHIVLPTTQRDMQGTLGATNVFNQGYGVAK